MIFHLRKKNAALYERMNKSCRLMKKKFLNVSKFSPKSLENICISSTQIFWKKSFHTKPKFFCGFVENSKQSITKSKYPFREKEKSLHQYRISKIGKFQKKLKNHYLHIYENPCPKFSFGAVLSVVKCP